MGSIFGVSEHSKSGGLIHATESSQSATANHTGQAVTRVAQQATTIWGKMKQVQQTLINDTLSQLIPTLLTAYAHYRAGSSKAESANAETRWRLA